MAVLQNCPIVISRLLRKDGSILRAVKILVISRRMHRTLSQYKQAPPLVGDMRNQLATLWRRLLRNIDRYLSNPNMTVNRLVEILCAFSLATSSSLTDVLKHFHQVRFDAINAQLEGHDGDHTKVLMALKLYSRTLQDTQAMLPKPMIDTLVKLKSQPLFKDAEIRAVVELNLDLHQQWMPDNIRNFTPWIGHEDLQKPEAERLLKAWAKRSFSAMLDGLHTMLSLVEDFRTLVRLRTDIFEMWFDSRNKVSNFDLSEPLQGLRSALNDRLVHLIRTRARRLHLVGTEMTATLQDWKSGITDEDEPLWTMATSMEVGEGAVKFKKTVMDRVHGRNTAVSRVMGCYETWVRLVEETITMIKELKDQKWEEDLEDEEDELALDSRQAQLSEDDPEMLDEELGNALSSAFRDLDEAISVATKASLAGDDAGQKALFLVRVLRNIRQRLPPKGDTGSFGLGLVSDLHTALSRVASTSSIQLFQDRLGKRFKRNLDSRALWEGSPPLPVQPSPDVFKLLHQLTTAMAKEADVWTLAAVETLKGVVRAELSQGVGELLDTTPEALVNGVHDIATDQSEGDGTGMPNGRVNGATEGEEQTTASSALEDAMIQLLYDTSLLKMVFEARASANPDGGMDALVQSVSRKAGLTEPLCERLQKGVQEYWKRTQLLFALLA